MTEPKKYKRILSLPKHTEVTLVSRPNISLIFGHSRRFGHRFEELLWVSPLNAIENIGKSKLQHYKNLLKNGPCDLMKTG